MQYKGVILDCDGVILDSNNFKVAAMRQSLRLYDALIVNGFIDYFKSNFGKSRQKHVEHFFSAHLQRPPTPGEEDKILAEYAKNCVLQYNSCSMCSGAYQFISRKNNFRLWVASGSDEKELNSVFKQRKIDVFFERILGSPKRKTDNVAEIIRSSNLDKSDFCLIGDSLADYEAAYENGIDFIFCSKYSNTPSIASTLPTEKVKIINSLEDIV
jgi:HAD superfamily hydrolase (TIGR01549 family)